TTEPGTGANDTITTGGSSDVVVGGDGADTIGSGNGDNVVVGDNGRVTQVAGRLLSILSTSTGADLAPQGGIDQVTTGSGNDTVIGGLCGGPTDAEGCTSHSVRS